LTYEIYNTWPSVKPRNGQANIPTLNPRDTKHRLQIYNQM